MSARYLLGVINLAVDGLLTDFNVLMLDFDTTFGVAFLTAVLTAAVAFGLRVLVLRALGAIAADAVIKNQICLTLIIYMKKPPSGGLMCQFVDWSSYVLQRIQMWYHLESQCPCIHYQTLTVDQCMLGVDFHLLHLCPMR